MLFLKIYTGLGYFICTRDINQFQKVWVDQLNERQEETHSLLSKKSKFHRTNLWVQTKNYNYLNPNQLLDLCCSLLQLFPLDCGSVVVLRRIFELSLHFTKKRLCRSVRWHFRQEVIQRLFRTQQNIYDRSFFEKS